MEKSAIINVLDERALLLPQLVRQALAANDRVKYYLALVQGACRHAAATEGAPAADLAAERRLAGVADDALDGVIAGSQRGPGDSYIVPEATRIVAAIIAEVRAMQAPLALAEAERDGVATTEARLAALTAAIAGVEGDLLPASLVPVLTAARREERDSVHLLVMDLHKALNRIQASLATERIDGAEAYAIEDTDRPLVAAFMAGLNETAQLKFDHPGLGTLATHSGDRLVVQNDIGTTDAHVLVIHVEGLTATLFYTDIHMQRLEFFQSLFDKRRVHWRDTRSQRAANLPENEMFYLCSGRFDADDTAELADNLAFIGSRLVFLIDWNKARKRLQALVRRGDAVRLLRWAAQHDYGHRGFLEIGAEQLIYGAIASGVRTPVRPGEKLHEMLGDEAAVAYLRFVLRVAAEGLLEHRSVALLREEVRAELLEYFHTAGEKLLDLVADHAAITADMAGVLRGGLLRPGIAADAARDAERLKRWESRADELVVAIRQLVGRTSGTASFQRLAEIADDAADGLEEAAFHLNLLADPLDAHSELTQQLQQLGELLAAASQEYVKALETAGHVRRGGARIDMRDFLSAIDRIIDLEHQTDAAQRRVVGCLVREAVDFRQMFVIDEIARNLEDAADALLRAALSLRDRTLGEVMAG